MQYASIIRLKTVRFHATKYNTNSSHVHWTISRIKRRKLDKIKHYLFMPKKKPIGQGFLVSGRPVAHVKNLSNDMPTDEPRGKAVSRWIGALQDSEAKNTRKMSSNTVIALRCDSSSTTPIFFYSRFNLWHAMYASSWQKYFKRPVPQTVASLPSKQDYTIRMQSTTRTLSSCSLKLDK